MIKLLKSTNLCGDYYLLPRGDSSMLHAVEAHNL